jgi:hypothetical protein
MTFDKLADRCLLFIDELRREVEALKKRVTALGG